MKKAVLTETIRTTREEEPARPSTRLSTNEASRWLAALLQKEPKP